MKKLYSIFLYLIIMTLSSCEEVVDIELQKSEPRLVVEASIIWEKDSNGNTHTIYLSTTTPFFDSDISPAENATIEISNNSGKIYKFNEVNPGIYITSNFLPELNKEYQLTIQYNNETYTATERMTPVVDIEDVEQSINGGFSGNDIELRAFYKDPPEITNFYKFNFFFEGVTIQISDDEFTNGNRTFAYFSNEDLEIGDEVIFEIQGISERFYEYLFILRSQAGENNAGPFQTQPTTVRGNIINETNPENFAFGYFRLSQANLFNYTIR